MATTTPNFGWAVPTSTDLVKDGAVAIETLGDSIDASLVDLKGGTTGQVLAKASGTDMDFSWTAIDPLVILDAKGDLITATAADTPARLAVGTNGQTLVADSSTATGLKWATAASGSTFAGCRIYNAGSITLSNNTATELTYDSELYDTDAYHSASPNPARITVPAGKAGYYLIYASVEFNSNASGAREVQIRKNGSLTNGSGYFQNFSSGGFTANVSSLVYLDVADYVSVYALQASGGNLTVFLSNNYQQFSAIYLGA